MRRPPRSLPAALLLGALFVARAASAQDVQFRAVIAAGIQVTDNVQFAPMNPVTGQQGPVPAFMAELNPAAILTYATPRSVNDLQYTLNFMSVFGVGQQYNYANRLEARSRYEVSELSTLNLALRAAQGQQTVFPDAQPGQAIAFVAPGTFSFFTLEATEGLNRALSEDVAFTQALGANMFVPIDATPPRPVVFGATSQLGLQYRDGNDTYGVTLGTQFAATGDIECDNDTQCGGRICAVATHRCVTPDTAAAPLRALLDARTNVPQLTNRLAVNERHDFTNGFTTEIDLGAQQIMRLTDGGGQFWQPAGRAAIRYEREEAAVALTFNHGMQLNIDLGGIVLADNVDLIGAIPLDRETRRFLLQLQAGYQRGTPIDAEGALLPGFNLFGGDAALAFRPERWLPNFLATLRYQFRYQITEPQAGVTRVPVELHAMRNAVALGVGFEFPERKPQ